MIGPIGINQIIKKKGTKFEAKVKLRAKSVNLEIKWANVRYKEKLVPKVQAWRTQGLKSKRRDFILSNSILIILG